jgi:signal peptidase
MITVRHVREWVVFAAFLVVAWVFVGPQQLGGPVAYVMVDGTSMVPTYSDGDLILAKARDSYHVGDVVTYVVNTSTQPFPVIHRIVKVNGDGSYVTRGDNRDGNDEFHVDNTNIVGASWIRIPHAGVVADFFRHPLGLGLLAAALVFSLLTKRGSGGAKGVGSPVSSESSSKVPARSGSVSEVENLTPQAPTV